MPCAAGTYSTEAGAANSSMCTVCPAGTFSPALGASNASTCQTCPLGSYSAIVGANAMSVCSECPAGTFSDVDGANSSSLCTSCPAGTFSSLTGANSSASCLACPSGTFSPIIGSNSSALCFACDAGTFSSVMGASNSSACTACPSGTFSSEIGANGSASCVPCPAGSFSPTTGASNSTTCLDLPAGLYSNQSGLNSTESAFQCPPGTYSTAVGATSSSTCQYCPAGTFSTVSGAPNSSVCELCPAGHQSSASADSCFLCPPGMFSNSSVNYICQACPVGHESSTDRTTCRQCPEGWFSNVSSVSQCVKCSNGTESHVSRAFCVACLPGWFSNDTTFRCTACQTPFSNSVHGASSCNQCLSGFWGPECQQCRVCANGGSCLDGKNGSGLCSCVEPFSGPNCTSCLTNMYGPSCSVFCNRTYTCNDHGTCSSTGSCLCDNAHRGRHCNVSTIVDLGIPQAPAFEVVSSEHGKTAVTTSVGLSAGGPGFMQMFDSVQSITRLGSLRLQFPIWYLQFIQGFSVVMMNVRMSVWESIGMIQSPDDADIDPLSDSNLRLYFMDTMQTYSACFIFTFTTMLTVLMAITTLFVGSFGCALAFLMLRRRFSFGPSDVGCKPSALFFRFWIFFRGIYFMLFYASIYPLLVTIGVQMTAGMRVRPAWETVLAFFVLFTECAIFFFGLMPLLRRGPSGPEAEFARQVDLGLFVYVGKYWWMHLGSITIFAIDAFFVVSGAELGLGTEVQLCFVACVSTARAIFFLYEHPSEERVSNAMHVLNSASDLLQLFSLYAMFGKGRSNTWNEDVTHFVAMFQLIVVTINLVVSLFEMVLMVARIGLVLGNKILAVTKKQDLNQLEIMPAKRPPASFSQAIGSDGASSVQGSASEYRFSTKLPSLTSLAVHRFAHQQKPPVSHSIQKTATLLPAPTNPLGAALAQGDSLRVTLVGLPPITTVWNEHCRRNTSAQIPKSAASTAIHFHPQADIFSPLSFLDSVRLVVDLR
eukprot:ANDGO_01904.mRNA.1 Laminin subunit alpha